MSVRAGDVYAAGMAIGRVLQDHNVDLDAQKAIVEIMRKLESMAGERRFPEPHMWPELPRTHYEGDGCDPPHKV